MQFTTHFPISAEESKFLILLCFLILMELQIIFSSIIIIFAFFLFLSLSIKIVKGLANNSNLKMPPGPWKLPLIGNLHQLVGSLPHHCLKDLSKKYGPLMHLQLGEVSTIVVSSPGLAKEVMKTHDLNFAQRPFLLSAKYVSYYYTDIALAPYGNYWRQLRKICTIELLSAKRVQSFRSTREDEVSNLVKAIYSNEGSIVNLSEKIFALTYGITARVAFGRKCKYQEEFISSVREMVKIAGGFGIADLYPSIKVLQLICGAKPKLEKLHHLSDQILENIIHEHKKRTKTTKTGLGEAQENIVDVFLSLQQDGDHGFSLTDSNIKAVIWGIFSARSEISSTTVEWIIAELLKNPKVMRKAQAEVRKVFSGKGKVDETLIHELKFLKSVIKETLRLHPPCPILLPRESRKSCEINGYEILAKTRVIVNTWVMGRDPRYWTKAETFYLERFLDRSVDYYRGMNFKYIPFGADRRMCPRISFALPNIELPLVQLLYHFDWKLSNKMRPEDLDMTEVFSVSVSVRKKENLFLVPDPYRPSSIE